jgi:hypothetical protein
MIENNAMQSLPPYLFARIEKKIEEAREKGIDIINLGIGDPDQPTPKHIIDRMAEAIYEAANHQYPSSVGLLSYRQAVANWYKRRFNVDLDAKTEVVSLLGSKEGIAHISFCYLNAGDINLVPAPGYPVYGIGTLLAGGESHIMPLKAENNFLPVLEDIPAEVARKAKLMFLNYPNNPTGAVADLAFFSRVIEFARNYDILVCHDAAYTELCYDGFNPPSFLEAPGAKEVGNGGQAITLVTSDDIMTLYEIEEHIGVMIPEAELPSEELLNERKASIEEWAQANSLKVEPSQKIVEYKTGSDRNRPSQSKPKQQGSKKSQRSLIVAAEPNNSEPADDIITVRIIIKPAVMPDNKADKADTPAQLETVQQDASSNRYPWFKRLLQRIRGK